jgi:spore maturation protein CgeB
MRFVMFYHSLVSDWNHGNAHFLRGIVSELLRQQHKVVVYEPQDGWSLENLLADQGHEALAAFRSAYPNLKSRFYALEGAALPREVIEEITRADVVIVHEWNEPALVNAVAEARGDARGNARRPRLFFHDTHHRVVSEPGASHQLHLDRYDAILAFGSSLADLYRAQHPGQRVFVWHEAADTAWFYPRDAAQLPSGPSGDLVWVGNWGDDERAAELDEFLIEPVRRLGLRAWVFGVRYPEAARAKLAAAGITYGGWLPNHAVPDVFARFRCTVHVPRRPYTKRLPGIPTIRPFEALACGIPLVSAPWSDSEHLFASGTDHLIARDREEMVGQLRSVLADGALARGLAAAGLRRIVVRHTCVHRVQELLAIVAKIDEPHWVGRSQELVA